MAESNINVMLDTVRKNNLITICAVKNDYGARFITAKITDNGKPRAIKQTATVTINAVRRDKAAKAFEGSVNEDGTVKVPVTQWMLDIVGDVECSVAIIADGTRLTTTSFYINAQKSIWDGVSEPSEDDPNHDVILEIIASENVRVANEESRIEAEAERVSAEQDRITAEENRKTAERERVTAETARAEAEEKRITAESERASAETARKAAETVRVNNEKARVDNENTRVTAENERVAAETARATAETARDTAEKERVSAENLRISAEEERNSAEAIREDRAAVFVENEMIRVQNEAARKTEFDKWSEEVGKISAFDKRISNLESAVMPDIVTPTIDNTMSYSKDVPEDALPYASINEIGGMSYKCNNFIPFPYTKDGMDGGDAKLVVGSDGGITGSGTPTSAISFGLANKIELQEGTYTLSTYGTFANILVQIDVYNSNGEVTLSRSIKDSLVFTTEKNGYVGILVKRGANGEVMSGTCYPMLNEGDTALPYEPYFQGLRDAKVTAVESVEANLTTMESDSYTMNGITFTKQSDGGVTINGTATKQAYLFLRKTDILNGTHIVSLSTDGAFNAGVFAYAALNSNSAYITTESGAKTITVSEVSPLKYISINVNEGSTISNQTFYVMINKGETALPYTPYTKHTIEIPEAIQALDGYGQGVNETFCNKLVWNPAEGVKKFVKQTERIVFDGTEQWVLQSANSYGLYNYYVNFVYRPGATNAICSHYRQSEELIASATTEGFMITSNGYVYIRTFAYTSVSEFKSYLAEQFAAGTPVTVQYVLAEPIETDISDYIGDDNFIGVESGGTVTAVNEYGYDVPFEVEYIVKGGSTSE